MNTVAVCNVTSTRNYFIIELNFIRNLLSHASPHTHSDYYQSLVRALPNLCSRQTPKVELDAYQQWIIHSTNAIRCGISNTCKFSHFLLNHTQADEIPNCRCDGIEFLFSFFSHSRSNLFQFKLLREPQTMKSGNIHSSRILFFLFFVPPHTCRMGRD